MIPHRHYRQLQTAPIFSTAPIARGSTSGHRLGQPSGMHLGANARDVAEELRFSEPVTLEVHNCSAGSAFEASLVSEHCPWIKDEKEALGRPPLTPYQLTSIS